MNALSHWASGHWNAILNRFSDIGPNSLNLYITMECTCRTLLIAPAANWSMEIQLREFAQSTKQNQKLFSALTHRERAIWSPRKCSVTPTVQPSLKSQGQCLESLSIVRNPPSFSLRGPPNCQAWRLTRTQNWALGFFSSTTWSFDGNSLYCQVNFQISTYSDQGKWGIPHNTVTYCWDPLRLTWDSSWISLGPSIPSGPCSCTTPWWNQGELFFLNILSLCLLAFQSNS